MEQLLTTKEACARLQIGRTTLLALAASGKIRRVKIGRLARWRPADLVAFIDGKSRRK